MPYIKNHIERIILDVIASNFFSNTNEITGRLNYLIHRIVIEYIRRNGESYSNYQKIVGELECTKLEIYRRMVSKYENKKIKENGDVE